MLKLRNRARGLSASSSSSKKALLLTVSDKLTPVSIATGEAEPVRACQEVFPLDFLWIAAAARPRLLGPRTGRRHRELRAAAQGPQLPTWLRCSRVSTLVVFADGWKLAEAVIFSVFFQGLILWQAMAVHVLSTQHQAYADLCSTDGWLR